MLKKFNNWRYTQISIYVVLVAGIIIGFNAFVDNVPYFFHLVIDRISWVMQASKPLILALVFSYLLEPVVAFFEKTYGKIFFLKKKQKSCRVYAALTVMLILVIIISGAISILIFTITDKLRVAKFDDIMVVTNVYINNLNDFYDTAMKWLDSANIQSAELQTYVKEAGMTLLDYLKTGSGQFMASISNISGFITTIILAFVMTTYILIDGKMLAEWTDKVTRSLCTKKMYHRLCGLTKDADEVFSGYIRGQFTDAFVMMILICVGLSVIGVKFAVMIGILAGFGNLIPYVGPVVAYAGTILVSIFTGEFKTCIIAILFLMVIQIVDGNIIGPKLLSNSIKIHPLLVIIFIVFGSAIGGLLGMLLAVPVGALLKMIFMRYIEKRLADRLRAEQEQAEEEAEAVDAEIVEEVME